MSIGQSQHKSTDSLQKKLISTRYSVIEQMFTVKDSLQKQQKVLKLQKQKMKMLQTRITQLQAADVIVKRKSLQIKRKLYKFQDTQGMAVTLLRDRALCEIEKQQKRESKRMMCASFRENLQQSKRNSLEIFQRLKKRRISRIRDEKKSFYEQKIQKSLSELQYRRSLSKATKQSEQSAKQRLKRYENFRMAQAKYNYDQKKIDYFKNYTQKISQLAGLKNQENSQEQFFRKTQMLNQQVQQIQSSLYITGE